MTDDELDQVVAELHTEIRNAEAAAAQMDDMAAREGSTRGWVTGMNLRNRASGMRRALIKLGYYRD